MKQAYRRTPQGTLRRLYKRVGGVLRWLGGCCCGGNTWIRAVACRVDTTPQVIVAPSDQFANPTCSNRGGACPVPGGLTVVYRNRCYVIETGPEELPPECQSGALVFAARIYETLPDGELLARFDCLPPEETCESPMCQLPPPIGCCVESQSIGCNGPRLCEGGKDVTLNFESYSDNIAYRFNGTIFERAQITQFWVVRRRCVGTVIVTTVDPSSFSESVFTDSNGGVRTVRNQPLNTSQAPFTEPGFAPSRWANLIATDGCDYHNTIPGFVENRVITSGCRSGTGHLDQTTTEIPSGIILRTFVEDASWSWTVPIACTRGSGLGDLPL